MATETATETGGEARQNSAVVVEMLSFLGLLALALSVLLLHVLLLITVYEVMDSVGAFTGEGQEVLEFALRLAFEVPIGALLGFVFTSTINTLKPDAVEYEHGVAFGALIVAVFVGLSFLVPGLNGGLVP